MRTKQSGGRGFCGIGIFHPKHEVNQGTLWRSAYAFGASFCFTVGPRFRKQAADTPDAWKHIPMYRFETVEDLKSHLPFSCPIVGIELHERSRPLHTFTHPERACYLLGAEDHGLPANVLEACHHLVQIDGLRMCLNVAVAGSMVLYDRVSRS